MTRKDFIAIAKVLHVYYKDTGYSDNIINIAEDLSEHLKETNPLFDKDRFMDAVKGV